MRFSLIFGFYFVITVALGQDAKAVGELNQLAFRNFAKDIERLFTHHMNGKPLTESVIKKMNNTIKFLEFFVSSKSENEKK